MKRNKSRVGRPPRTDSPEAIRVLLPANTRRRLKLVATMEGTSQGDIIARALESYFQPYVAAIKATERITRAE